MGEGRRYHAGIDGLRGVAVVLVLVFHGGLGWLPGGFLGVSVFFTLSGYLITGLLLDEIEAHGRISFRRFWGRRLRRLAPAGLACLAVVAAVGPRLAGDAAGAVRTDVLAALGYVANWRFVWSHHSYADLFAAPSPVQHFWSLAIEEQFYVVLPLLVGLVAWLGGRRRALTVTMGALLLGSVVLSAVVSNPDRVYYGTDTRAAELLVGGLMACIFSRRLADVRVAGRVTRVVSVGGLLAVAAVIVVSAIAEQGDGWLYGGGLAAFALLSALAVAGAIVPGPAKALLSWPPLVAIGTVSYGLYLYHWPLFVWLTPERLGFGGVARFAFLLVVTAGVAVLSFGYLEQPVRSRTTLRRPLTASAAFVGGVVLVLLGTAVVPLPRPSLASGLDGSDGPVLLPSGDSTAVESTVAGGTTPSVPVVLVLGSDGRLARALAEWRFDEDLRIEDRTNSACPIFRADASSVTVGSPAPCPDFRQAWVAAVAATRPDLVVIAIGDQERRTFELAGVVVDDALRRQETVAAMRLAVSLDAPVVINDALGRSADVVAQAVRSVADSVGPPRLRVVPDAGLSRRLVDAVRSARPLTRGVHSVPRVLVVGDSTARSVAQGLSDGADGRLQVVSAGVYGCPVVTTAAVRPAVRQERDSSYCPAMPTVLPEWLDAYGADLVLVVAGPAEQWTQRYPDDPAWYEPGSAGYVRAHVRLLDSVIPVLVGRGAVLVVLEPPVTDVADGELGGDEHSRAAWADVVASWDRAWVPVAELPYASLWSDPTTAQGRAERPDGVHPDHAVMEALARDTLVPQLIAVDARLRDEMAATGCGEGAELARCRS